MNSLEGWSHRGSDDQHRDGSAHTPNDRETTLQRVINWMYFDPTQRKTPTSNPKNYEHVKSNFVFILGGRFKFGKATPLSFLVGVIILIAGGLFLGFEARWLWHHISPAIVIIFAYIWLICISAFIKASTSDPGVLPRNIHLVDNPFNTPQEYFNIISLPSETGMNVEVKYCPTCHIWRLPRSSHCSRCNTCVEIHDHHCIWLNNCIGLRNYKYFLWLLSSGVLLYSYIIVFSLIMLSMESKSDGWISAIHAHPTSLFMTIYGFLALSYPALLLTYHLFLNFHGYTTREYLNYVKESPDYKNAYALKSSWKSFVTYWCRPTGHQLVRMRDDFVRGDRRFDAMPKAKSFVS